MNARSRGEQSRDRASIHEVPWRPGGGSGKQWHDVSKITPVDPGGGQGVAGRINVKRAHERRSTGMGSRAGTPTRGRVPARMGGWGQATTSSEFRLSFRSDMLNRTKRLIAEQGRIRQKAVGQVPVFTGLETFTLRSLALTSLNGLGVHPEVKRIYMQNNMLTSFEGWEMQPRLHELHAEDNLIETLRGLTEQPRLEILWLKGNPVTSLYCYRLMCIAVVGKSLRMIDGEPVRRHEMERALSLGPSIAEAIRDGWVLDTVPALDADYDMVLEQYAYFRKQSLPLAQWATAAASDESDEEHDHRWRNQSPYGSRASSPYPSRPGSRNGSRAASPFHPPRRSAHGDHDNDYDAMGASSYSASASPHGILRRHGKNAASLREKLSGASGSAGVLRGERSGEWASAPVGERDGVPVRARVQVARLLDILTTESNVLEVQLERQLEAQLEALASVQARSSSRLGEDRGGLRGAANVNSSTHTSPAPSSTATSLHHEVGSRSNGVEEEDKEKRDVSGGLSLRERVERREAAARAEAVAAATASAAALNGDQKLVTLLQEWATLRDSRAAIRRTVVVEDYPDDSEYRYPVSGGMACNMTYLCVILLVLCVT